jgi:hypothetical protein
MLHYVCLGKSLHSSPRRGKTLHPSNVGMCLELRKLDAKIRVSACQYGISNILTTVVQWSMLRSLLPNVILVFTNFGRNLTGNIRNASLAHYLRLLSSFLTNRTWWMMSPNENDDLYAWIQCLADAVNCGVHMILRIPHSVFRIHCKSLDKVIIFRPA